MTWKALEKSKSCSWYLKEISVCINNIFFHRNIAHLKIDGTFNTDTFKLFTPFSSNENVRMKSVSQCRLLRWWITDVALSRRKGKVEQRGVGDGVGLHGCTFLSRAVFP